MRRVCAVPARGGGERCAVTLAAIQHHQQPVVLVVGMRGGVHEDADVVEMPQREPKRDVPLLFVDRHDAHLSGRNDGEGEEKDKSGEKRTPHEGIIPAGRAGQAGRAGRAGWAGSESLHPFLPFPPILPFLPIPPFPPYSALRIAL